MLNQMTTNQKIDAIYNEIVNNNKFLDIINIISFSITLYNLYLNKEQAYMDDILQELHKQNKDYLEKIIQLLNNKGENNDNK